MQGYEFDAVIWKREGMDAAFIEFPFDVEKEFGAKGQVKVKATHRAVYPPSIMSAAPVR